MPEPYWQDADGAVRLYLGDCLDVLRTLPDASVDAVVTDPPYALAELSTALVLEAIAAWMRGDREYVPDGPGGFMGRQWDRFVPPPGAWDECMRALKPGGHLLAFAAPRTYDLMCLSIRIAGFEIRDAIADWIFGSGFPKSHDVGKAIDKAAGVEREVIGTRVYAGGHVQRSSTDKLAPPIGTFARTQDARQETAPATAEAARWDGWGTALKPAHEPIIVARKPLAGTVAGNVLEYGTGALNIAACRVAAAGRPLRVANRRDGNQVYGDRLHGSLAAGVTSEGRWPANVIFSHPPLVVDGEVVGDACADGCVDGCPVAELDRQSGVSVSRIGKPRGADAGDGWGMTKTGAEYADSGGASRFFPAFRYEAKAPASERPKLPDGTAWPTVKPVALMRWLVRLVVPPGGTALDPFAGTGATGEAAVIEGFRTLLIERDPTAAELIRTRLSKPIAPALDLGDLT